MWCQNCRQDVPGIASTGEVRYTCARCGQPILIGTVSAKDAVGSTIEPFSDFDNWRWNEKLRRAERVVRRRGSGGRSADELIAMDVPHELPGGWHPSLAVSREAGRAHRSRVSRAVSLVAWSLLSVGLAAFVCGGVLSGWSLLASRAELWNVGMPIALAGQLALLIGLVLQLDRLGQDNRRQAEKLDRVGKQLEDLSGRRRIDPPERHSPSVTPSKTALTSTMGSKNIPPPSASGGIHD